MPWIIDYPVVLEQMREQRFKSLYYNSGAFGFPAPIQPEIVGWIGPADSTLTAKASAMAMAVGEPFEENLGALLRRVWQEHLPGRAWVMPMSHWSYELDFGSRDWLPALLEGLGLDPGQLTARNNAAAIEFAPNEPEMLERMVVRLLQMLHQSDFALFFPRRPVLLTLHHHKQLWWQTTDPELVGILRRLPGELK